MHLPNMYKTDMLLNYILISKRESLKLTIKRCLHADNPVYKLNEISNNLIIKNHKCMQECGNTLPASI